MSFLKLGRMNGLLKMELDETSPLLSQNVVARNSLIHTLGNLTLLTQSLNISSSNSGFLEKRAKFEEHTGLFLNKWFLKHEKWMEVEIGERGEELAKISKGIWVSL